jgi:hypothetical protein
MNDEKNKIPVNEITGRNTPNDDEEILKKGDENMEDTIKADKQNTRQKKNETSQGSETSGIP